MKNKKIICFILCILSIICNLVLSVNAEDNSTSDLAGTTINVYNWGQYISDGTDDSIDVNALFTEATGIEVNYTTFDSNETMYTKLKAGGTSYDVIIPSDYMIGRLIAEDMLEKLDFSNIPNYQFIDESHKNQDYDPNNEYSVPYTWGTVGIVYNSKYVEKPDSWDVLWNSDYSGKILMFDNQRDAFAIAQSLLGYNYNSEDYEEYKACAELLKEQKPYLQNYVMDQIYDKMINEEAYIAPYYAGDFLQMKEDNDDLEFVFPKESFNVFIDAFCIPKGSKNKAAAEAYINFLSSPEISGQNMDYLGYSTPISDAKEYLDEEIANSPIAYPDDKTLSRAISYSFIDTKVTQFVDSLWTSVKTDVSVVGTKEYYTSLIGIIIVFVIAAIVLTYFEIRKRKRIKARHSYKTK